MKFIDYYRIFVIRYFDKYVKKSYSQEGEDMILGRIFINLSYGFYVDIGAHHPKRFSNTQYFYNKGWNGINIDALPGTKYLFDRIRPNDTNIEVAISDNKNDTIYFSFDDAAYNTTVEEVAKKLIDDGKKYLGKLTTPCMRLMDVFEKHISSDIEISFLSVDVEGREIDVLRSNNWDKYRPVIICVEGLYNNLSDLEQCEVHVFLKQNDYILIAKTINTWFYRDQNIDVDVLRKIYIPK